MSKTEERLANIRDIVIEVLELEDDELTDTALFVEELEADSLRAIEIMSRLEKKFNVRIPQNELTKMTNVENVFKVLSEHAHWEEETLA